MSASDKDLEKLLEAGKKLLGPLPSSVQKLLQLLDNLFLCLTLEVEQVPPDSIKNALSPLMEALVAERLLKHSDVDVKVSVTSCITEVMRIIAPVAPCDDDDKMREVFRLIVSSFEHLADKSSLSYTKRTRILDAMARCQACVLMLDLECDALFIEMFQHFLRALRDHHPVRVFLDMEKIMTLVLEESDHIPPELLSPILDYVKKDDEVPQRSRRLVEQVLTNCSSRCKTSLAVAVTSSGVSLENYSNVVVALIFAGAFSYFNDDEVLKESQRCADQVLGRCTSLLKYLTEAVKSSSVSIDKHSNVVDSICEGAFNALNQEEVVANEKEKAAKVSTPEQTCVPKRRLNLSLPHEEDPAETETPTHKRARVQSCSPHGEIETTAAEGEPSLRTHKSSPEPGNSQPCSVTHQVAKVKQSIVDSITSVRQIRSELETKEQSLVDTVTVVRQFRPLLETEEQSIVDTLTSLRQFRSEIMEKEDNLEASLQEVDVMGEKIMVINKILHSYNRV